MPVHFTSLETDHLVIRRFRDDDLSSLLVYRTDPEVARFQTWGHATPEAVLYFIQEMKAAEPGRPGEWFQFSLELKASGAQIGDVGLHTLAADPRQAEIGYTLAREYQGQGLATEAVSAVLNCAFCTLNMHRITALADYANTASIRLMERLGMRREAHYRASFWDGGAWRDEVRYAILREEWVSGDHAGPDCRES